MTWGWLLAALILPRSSSQAVQGDKCTHPSLSLLLSLFFLPSPSSSPFPPLSLLLTSPPPPLSSPSSPLFSLLPYPSSSTLPIPLRHFYYLLHPDDSFPCLIPLSHSYVSFSCPIPISHIPFPCLIPLSHSPSIHPCGHSCEDTGGGFE